MFRSSARWCLNLSADLLDTVMHRQIQRDLSLKGAKPCMGKAPDIQPRTIETLYIHIPFCHTLCRFCSFHKIKYEPELARQYFILLREEIKATFALGYQFNRVYIGGGTTTILEDELIDTILLIKRLGNIQEVTCESDPLYFKQGNPKKLKGLVDRISIGIQSFDDEILRKTGRYEKFGSGREQMAAIRSAVQIFPTVNIDLMYGFAGQTKEKLSYDLKQAIKLKPTQITTYPLTTGIGKLKKKSAILAGQPHELFSLYQVTKTILSKKYHMNTPWTFTDKSKVETAHKYVLDGESCYGIGSGAFGRSGNDFYISNFDIPTYLRQIQSFSSGLSFHHQIKNKSLTQHHLMIMMGYGYLDEQVFQQETGKTLWQGLPLEMSFLKLIGAIEKQEGVWRTTDKGQFIALKMFSGFLAGMDYLREQAKALVEDDETNSATKASSRLKRQVTLRAKKAEIIDQA